MADITAAEIAEKTRVTESGCCVWMGSSSVIGYGLIHREGQTFYAHRVACALAHGPQPKDKPFVLHSCDVKLCCNPEHLRWGSAKENSADATARRDGNHDFRRLTPNIVREARRDHAAGSPLGALAVRYDVPYVTLYQAVKGATWKHVV